MIRSIAISSAMSIGQKLSPVLAALTNDWYDPDFVQMYPVDAEAYLTATDLDFAFLSTNTLFVTELDGYHCARFFSPNVNVNNMVPAWTKGYFDSLGYNIGDRLKIGFWIKFPDASPTSTRRVYYGGGESYENSELISDASWHWIETAVDFYVTADIWQKIYIGPRYAESGESVYVRGLTLTNLDKMEWQGELPSVRQTRALATPFKNLNAYVEKIYKHSPMYERAIEQNGAGFTKEIINVSEFGIDGVRFTASTAGTLLRMNIGNCRINYTDVDALYLSEDSRKLKYGFWVRANVPVNSSGIFIYMGEANYADDRYFYRKLEHNVWHWVEFPFKKLSSGLKDYLGNAQINAEPANAGDAMQLDVCGLTIGYLNEQLAFRYTTNNVASQSAYYKQVYGSYGDSITAANGYQRWINATLGCDYANRGIGGTTVANQSSIAWVDNSGYYLGRPPDAPPSGTEGIDYFEIESSMCRQERIDTLPAAARLITVMGGLNDWSQDIAIGNPSDPASDTVGAGFCASYKSMLDKIQTRCPSADIVILNLTYRSGELTTPNSNGNYIEDYRIAIRTIASERGLKIIETNSVGINEANWSTYAIDSVHPNSKGYELIGRHVSPQL